MDCNPEHDGLVREAAIKILCEKAELRAKNRRMREALRGIAVFARERDFTLYVGSIADAAEQALEGSEE